MCGIAGIVARSTPGPEANAQLRRMLGLIVHRGPDGEGVHVEPGIAIGMRRLSIIDLEGGQQPIWNEDRSIGIVFNGEIYNYVELRAELEQQGHVFKTGSDTEVLVHLYEETGDQMFSRLRGMFAFAIFDRPRRSVLIARDHFGQKPLYYSSQNGAFAFASELKCLLAVPWVRRDLDSDAFLDYASWLSLPSPRTHFRSIHKLPAGSFVRIALDAPDRVEPVRYWRYELSVEPDLTDEGEAMEALEINILTRIGYANPYLDIEDA